MKRTFLKMMAAGLLLVGATLTSTAQADSEVLGAAIGGGAGAWVGHSMNGRNGAIVGGVIGAAAGAAIAGSDSPRYYESRPSYRSRPYVEYVPPPPVVYYRQPPPVVYYRQPPMVVMPAPAYYKPYPYYRRGDDHYRHRRHHRHDDDD